MLEDALKDMQGAIRKDKKTYSPERQSYRDSHHFNSIKRANIDSPSAKNNRQSRIPQIKGSVDSKKEKRRHNFTRSSERKDSSKDRSLSARRQYENPTQASFFRNFSNQRKSVEQAPDEEAESMEMQPPIPYIQNKPK